MNSSSRKRACVSRSILDFFPAQCSPKETVAALPSPPVSPPVPDPHLTTFQLAVQTALSIAKLALSPDELRLIEEFSAMSTGAQTIFVRLMNRKGFWYYLKGVEYGFDAKEAANELRKCDFAIGTQDALFATEETLYELLKSLRKADLLSLLTSARETLILLTGEDHTEAAPAPFPRPEHNPLYAAYRLAETEMVSSSLRSLQIALNDYFQARNTKPKGRLAALLYEIISEIKRKVGDLKAEWVVSKRNAVLGNKKGSNSWVSSLFPADFPSLLSLSRSAIRVFRRLLCVFSFYHPKESLESLMLLQLSENSPLHFVASPANSALFPERGDVLLCFDACLLESALASLPTFHFSKETEGQIAQSLAEVYLFQSASDQTGCIPSLSYFLCVYQFPADSVPWRSEYRSAWRWTRVAHRCVSYLEKAGLWSFCVSVLVNLLARPLYYQRRGLWWERLILDTSRYMKDPETARKLAAFALSDPFVRTGKRAIIEKQATRLGVAIEFPLIPPSDGYFSQFVHANYSIVTIKAKHVQSEGGLLYVGDDAIAMRVEEYAIWWYSRFGWKGFHCENALFRALFGVLLWPVLYSDAVPGAFAHSYQSAALDYKSECFFAAREELFQREFELIRSTPDLRSLFCERVSMYQGCRSAYIDWDQVASWGIPNLVEILDAIDRSVLLSIFLILAQDFKFTNHGLPDLLLWKGREVRLVEVKSENDRLAPHQKLWIKRLAEMGMKVELLHVRND